MKKQISLLILVNILLQVASQGWEWEDEDPYFLTSQRPPKPTRSTPDNPTPSILTPTKATPLPSPIPSTTPDKNYRRCLKRCPSTSEYNPICGTDNITYDNEGRVLCAKKCGTVVEKLYDGVCGMSATTKRTTTTATTTTIPSPVTPDPVCLKRCPKTGEYNPLCGTNNMIYDNEGRLRCAQQCGVNVQKLYSGPCRRVPIPTVAPPPSRTTLPPNFRACIRQCIVSSQYQPVCATDGTTYNNESELMCDISCKKNVQKQRDGGC